MQILPHSLLNNRIESVNEYNRQTYMRRVEDYNSIHQPRGLSCDAISDQSAPIMANEHTMAPAPQRTDPRTIIRTEIPLFEHEHSLTYRIQHFTRAVARQAIAPTVSRQV